MTDLWATISRTPDTGTIDLRHVYPTNPDDLWDALTNPERAARWFGQLSGELCEGGSYLVVFDERDQSQRNFGTVERCDPPRELRLSWQAPGTGASHVMAILTPVATGTELHLVHSGLRHGEDIGHAAGWQVHLTGLEDCLVGATNPDAWDAWAPLCESYAATLT